MWGGGWNWYDPYSMGKGYGKKGKGKGKGRKGKDKQAAQAEAEPKPEISDISDERQEQLVAGVDEFVESDDTSWALPSELTGMERKFIHQVAEERGLSSQSFGAGKERYITLFKPEEALTLDAEFEEEQEEIDPDSIQFSGIKVDSEARKTLLGGLVEIPEGWRIKAQVCLLCKNGLAKAHHDKRDIRSEMQHVKDQLAKLHPHQNVSFKVVSTGQSETSLAVGILLPKEVTCVQRTPHITIAVAPDAPAMIASRSIDIKTWEPIDGPTMHGEIIQVPKGENYVEPAGEALSRKRAAAEETPVEGAVKRTAFDAALDRALHNKGKGKKGGKVASSQQETTKPANVRPSPPVRTSMALPAPKVATENEDDLLTELAGGEEPDAAEDGSVDDFLLSLCKPSKKEAKAAAPVKPAAAAAPVKPAPAAAPVRSAPIGAPQPNKEVAKKVVPARVVPQKNSAVKKETSFEEDLLLMCGGSLS